MKLFVILVELDGKFLGPDALPLTILRRFLEKRVQEAIDFRGQVRDSKIIEGGERCMIGKHGNLYSIDGA